MSEHKWSNPLNKQWYCVESGLLLDMENNVIEIGKIASILNELTETAIGNAKEIDLLNEKVKSLKKTIKEFEVYGTDECPECIREEGVHYGDDYNRMTLYYRPKEHEIHNRKTECKSNLGE